MRKALSALAVYAIAMAMVEAAVVIYLRALYYPSGFFIKSAADLAVMPPDILKVELWREAATIVMLLSVGFLSFSTWRHRVLAFLFTFSIWDLFYYLFLFIFLGWPPSFSTLDMYFLIPWPWVGPVWFPVALFIAVGTFSLCQLTKERP